MRAAKEILFGSGCQTVNCEKMAEAVGVAPTTLRRWRKGEFPPALIQFARICKVRQLTDEEIGKVVRQLWWL